jgi:putative ABC transport system permease protein
LLRGREFTRADNANSPPVAIIDATLARLTFGDENPVGNRIDVATDVTDGKPVWREIVGVAADIKRYGLRDGTSRPGFFLPFAQQPRMRMTVLVRAQQSNLDDLLPAFRQVVHDLDPAVAIYRPFSLADSVRKTFALSQVVSTALTIFTCFAIALAAFGIAGVVAFNVTQRAHEIGVRLALGAMPADIHRSLVAQSMRPVLLGLVAGLACSVVFSLLWINLLYVSSPGGLVTLAAAAAAFAAIAILASYLPARHATRGDPLAVLRAE